MTKKKLLFIPLLAFPLLSLCLLFPSSTKETIGTVPIEYPNKLEESQKRNLEKYKQDVAYLDPSLQQHVKKIIFTTDSIADVVEQQTGEKIGESEREIDDIYRVGGVTFPDNHFIYISLNDYGAQLITHEAIHVLDINIGKKVGERPSHSKAFAELVEKNATQLELTPYENSSPDEQFVAVLLRAYYYPGKTQEEMPEVWEYLTSLSDRLSNKISMTLIGDVSKNRQILGNAGDEFRRDFLKRSRKKPTNERYTNKIFETRSMRKL